MIFTDVRLLIAQRLPAHVRDFVARVEGVDQLGEVALQLAGHPLGDHGGVFKGGVFVDFD